MNPSQYRKLPRHFNPYQTFLLDLTHNEAQTLNHLLPKGCLLTQQSKSKLKHHILKNKAQQNLHHHHYNSMMHNQSSSNKHPVMKEVSIPKNTQKPAQKKIVKSEIPQEVKPCVALLQQLKVCKHAWPFLQPVDAQALGIPEYYQIVTEPMDLSKVQQKLKFAQYKTPQQFYRDINLIIKNSYDFNSANEEFIKLTGDFERYFWRIAGPEAKPVNDKKLEREKEKERERLQKERLKEEKLREKMLEKEKERQRKLLLQQQQQAQQAVRLAKKKKKLIPKDILQAQNISMQQKLQLASSIHNLPKQHLKGIRQIVFSDMKQDEGPVRVTNEFDIEKIGYKKIRQLQKFVRNKQHEMENMKQGDERVERKNEVDLDQMESQWSQEFVD